MKLLLSIAFIGSMYFGYSYVYSDYTRIKQEIQQESICLNNLISRGIERIDIHTTGGKCEVMKNGYYIK